MAERKHLKKSERMEIYNKTGGHCAYCGCELRYEDKGNCYFCGEKMQSVSIGWKCEKCGGLLDMKGNWHTAVKELFMPDDVLKEQDEAAGGKYRRAIERMGDFGKLFVEYEGDPRGPVGRAGGMSIEDEAQTIPVLTDVDGGAWRPVQEEVLQDLLKQFDYWKET